MIFQIDFNRPDPNNNKAFYKHIGAKLNTSDDYHFYEIELNTFEELEALIEKVNKKTGDWYSAVISFDHPTIYLDNKA